MVIALSVIYVIACIKWGAWRRWREFYPTILFCIIANLAYDYVFYEYPLWEFHALRHHILTDFIIMFVIHTSAVIIFLSHWPQRCLFKPLYVLAWAAVNTLLEFVSFLLGGITYHHGWSVLWSFGLYFGGFALLRLHHQRPLLVWPIGAALGVLTALIFGLPPEALR